MEKRKRKMSSSAKVKKQRTMHSNSRPACRFVWATLERTAVPWPAEVKNGSLVFVKSDNAILRAISKESFPGNLERIKEESLAILKKKKMLKTSKLFLQDIEWAVNENEMIDNEIITKTDEKECRQTCIHIEEYSRNDPHDNEIGTKAGEKECRQTYIHIEESSRNDPYDNEIGTKTDEKECHLTNIHINESSRNDPHDKGICTQAGEKECRQNNIHTEESSRKDPHDNEIGTKAGEKECRQTYVHTEETSKKDPHDNEIGTKAGEKECCQTYVHTEETSKKDPCDNEIGTKAGEKECRQTNVHTEESSRKDPRDNEIGTKAGEKECRQTNVHTEESIRKDPRDNEIGTKAGEKECRKTNMHTEESIRKDPRDNEICTKAGEKECRQTNMHTGESSRKDPRDNETGTKAGEKECRQTSIHTEESSRKDPRDDEICTKAGEKECRQTSIHTEESSRKDPRDNEICTKAGEKECRRTNIHTEESSRKDPRDNEICTKAGEKECRQTNIHTEESSRKDPRDDEICTKAGEKECRQTNIHTEESSRKDPRDNEICTKAGEKECRQTNIHTEESRRKDPRDNEICTKAGEKECHLTNIHTEESNRNDPHDNEIGTKAGENECYQTNIAIEESDNNDLDSPEEFDSSFNDPTYVEESDIDSDSYATKSPTRIGLMEEVQTTQNADIEATDLVDNLSDNFDDASSVEESDYESLSNETGQNILTGNLNDVQALRGNNICYSIRGSDIIRDKNMPGIYVRKLKKSNKSSKAQAKSKKPGNTRVYDNFHSCLFCKQMRLHIQTHMKIHRKNPEVSKILKMEKPDFTKLRKLGDHKHNYRVIKEGMGELILSRRAADMSELDVAQYGACTNCKEWLLLKNMKRHLEMCSKQKVLISKRQVIIMSQVESGVIGTKPSRLMFTEVFPSMRMDEVSDVAKSDETIVALGESWLRRSIDNKEKRRYYTSQHMRLMAKVLIELRRLDQVDGNISSDKTFADYMKPSEFDRIIAAALECCFPFMDDMEELKAPSNGIKIKYDLKRMLTARWALLVKTDKHNEAIEEVKTCLELVSIEWGEKITKLARAIMVRRQFSIRKELPAPDDVRRLTEHVSSQLRSAELTPENFSRIVMLAQTRILLYNKRRSGEINAIRLLSYAGKTRSLDDIDESLVGELTEVEKFLLKSQDLMKVRGKGNRPVPVIIPKDVQEPLDFIASRDARRAAGILDENVYLFPLAPGLNPARSYDSLKKICAECSLVAPCRITSVSMRKYTATLTQMLNLDNNEMEWVCQHLGHTGNIHKTHYRQISGFIERVHVTKMFLLQDMNMTQKFRGKKLEEIDLSDIVFPDKSDETDDDDNKLTDAIIDNFPKQERAQDVDELVFENAESDSEDDLENDLKNVEDSQEQPRQRPKKHEKTVRKRWDEFEMEEIKKYFSTFLECQICPRTKDVEAAKKKSQKNNGKIWMRSNDKIVKKISNMNHKRQ